MIGHPQGASGAAGIVTAALALRDGFLPPTINQRSPDPDCDLDFIPNTGRAAQTEAALCNCLGFGSKNSAIVLGKGQKVAGCRRCQIARVQRLCQSAEVALWLPPSGGSWRCTCT